MTEQKRLLVRLPGGLGKQIAATAALKAWHAANPGGILDVESPYPDVFRGLPFIRRTYALGQPRAYAYDDHSDFEIMAGEPYHRLAFRQGREHLVDSYCALLGVEPPADKRGVIRLTDQEHQAALQLTAQIDRSRPWVAFQPWGGTSFYDPTPAQDPMRPKQVRDLPPDVAQGIVDRLVAAGCVVIQISLPTERRLERTIWFDLGRNQQTGQPNVMHPRVMFAVLNLCNKLVAIDSSAQHAWAALRKPDKSAVILWGATRPANFGYANQHNITLRACPTPGCTRPDLAIPDVVDGANTWACPHDGACMAHNPETVARLVLGQEAGETGAKEPDEVIAPPAPLAQAATEAAA